MPTEQSITISANSSYTVTGNSTQTMGIWEVADSGKSGSKLIANIGFNGSASTYPGIGIISSIGGIERYVSITKDNGWSFEINNLTNGNLTVKIRHI